MCCSYEKYDIRDTDNETCKFRCNNSETNRLDISNIKLGKYIYTLKFNTVC